MHILYSLLVEFPVAFSQVSSVVVENGMSTLVCLSADTSLTEIPIAVYLSTVDGTAIGELLLLS